MKELLDASIGMATISMLLVIGMSISNWTMNFLENSSRNNFELLIIHITPSTNAWIYEDINIQDSCIESISTDGYQAGIWTINESKSEKSQCPEFWKRFESLHHCNDEVIMVNLSQNRVHCWKKPSNTIEWTNSITGMTTMIFWFARLYMVIAITLGVIYSLIHPENVNIIMSKILSLVQHIMKFQSIHYFIECLYRGESYSHHW